MVWEKSLWRQVSETKYFFLCGCWKKNKEKIQDLLKRKIYKSFAKKKSLSNQSETSNLPNSHFSIRTSQHPSSASNLGTTLHLPGRCCDTGAGCSGMRLRLHMWMGVEGWRLTLKWVVSEVFDCDFDGFHSCAMNFYSHAVSKVHRKGNGSGWMCINCAWKYMWGRKI